jgi:hypothetical protein
MWLDCATRQQMVTAEFARELERENARLKARGDHWQSRSDTADHENARLRDAVSPKKLADSLVRSGLIQCESIDFPEGYDAGETLAMIADLSKDIFMNAPTHQPPFTLHLEEFESGGSKYIRCEMDNQRHYLSHLLNGAGACFFAEELPKIQTLANAHGWIVKLVPFPNASDQRHLPAKGEHE